MILNNKNFKETSAMLKKLLSLLLLLSVSACGDSENDVMRLGTSPDYPPFEYKKDGKIIGFDIAAAELIAQKMHKKLKIYEMDFNSLIPALQSGKVDFIASGLTKSSEREKNIDFSNVYYQAKVVGLFFPKNNIKDIGDLEGKKIGAQLGSVMQSFAGEIKDAKVISLANNLHLLEELKLGRIDILLVEQGQTKSFLDVNHDLRSITFIQAGEGYAFGFAKKSPIKAEFNRALMQLQGEGEFEKLEQIWLNKE